MNEPTMEDHLKKQIMKASQLLSGYMKRYRERYSLNQAKMAEKLGVSGSRYIEIERGTGRYKVDYELFVKVSLLEYQNLSDFIAAEFPKPKSRGSQDNPVAIFNDLQVDLLHEFSKLVKDKKAAGTLIPSPLDWIFDLMSKVLSGNYQQRLEAEIAILAHYSSHVAITDNEKAIVKNRLIKIFRDR